MLGTASRRTISGAMKRRVPSTAERLLAVDADVVVVADERLAGGGVEEDVAEADVAIAEPLVVQARKLSASSMHSRQIVENDTSTCRSAARPSRRGDWGGSASRSRSRARGGARPALGARGSGGPGRLGPTSSAMASRCHGVAVWVKYHLSATTPPPSVRSASYTAPWPPSPMSLVTEYRRPEAADVSSVPAVNMVRRHALLRLSDGTTGCGTGTVGRHGRGGAGGWRSDRDRCSRGARCTSSSSPTARAPWRPTARCRPSTTPCARRSRTSSTSPRRTRTPRSLFRAVAFSTGARWHVADPTPVERLTWEDLHAGGYTDLGAALDAPRRRAAGAAHGRAGPPAGDRARVRWHCRLTTFGWG